MDNVEITLNAKNIKRITLMVAACLLFLCGAANGQGKPEPVLVDEFGAVNCEEVLARTDSFFSQFYNEHSTLGYAVIYPKAGDPATGFLYESILRGNVAFRRFPAERLIILRAKELVELKIQFWKVPAGANKLAVESTDWEKTASSSTKPMLLNARESDDHCPSVNDFPGIYAKILRTNPRARGNVVIRGRRSHFRRNTAQLIKELTGEQGIPRHRLRFYYVVEPTQFPDMPTVEFWYVPPRNRRKE